MSIIKKLKLYRIKTVLRYIPESWKNSATLIEFSKRGRLISYGDNIFRNQHSPAAIFQKMYHSPSNWFVVISPKCDCIPKLQLFFAYYRI